MSGGQDGFWTKNRAGARPGSGQSDALVLSPRGDAAPDVALGLVLVQDGLYLFVKGVVDGGQTLAQILMYGYQELERYCQALSHQEAAGRYPHCHPYPLRFFE